MSLALPTREHLTYMATLKALQYAQTKPATYDLAREMLTVGLALPQECKARYINGLAVVFKDDDGDPADWLKFRAKLQQLLLKGQALVQATDLVLQDWRLNEAEMKQMALFGHQSVQEVGGVRVDGQTGEVLPDERRS